MTITATELENLYDRQSTRLARLRRRPNTRATAKVLAQDRRDEVEELNWLSLSRYLMDPE